MIFFRISAPGKVILFGEHAVVYGKTAVAASLNCRTHLDFIELNELEIQIEMPKLDIKQKISVTQLQKSLFTSDFPKLNADNHSEVYQRVQNFVNTQIGVEDSHQKVSLACFIYALVQVVQADGLELKGFRMKVDTDLSIGAGAGSSASFSVSLVAAFLRWSQLQKRHDAPGVWDDESLNKISRYALNCEKIMHGSPSGIDNSICTFGSLIEFRKGASPNFVKLGSKSLRVLLVDTKVSRSTKVLVDNFAKLKTKYPEIFDRILDSIDSVSKRAIDIVKLMSNFKDDEHQKILEVHKELAVLIDINQGLLSTCQVSHTTLDLICLTAKKYGFSAKLTGAGGGGFAYILIPSDVSNSKVQQLNSELVKNGFFVIDTSLGCSGVEIHDSAWMK